MIRVILCLIFSCSTLFANFNNKYIFLGINANHSTKIKKIKKKFKISSNKIDIKKPKIKRENSFSLGKIFQYTKFKKLSENKSLCGICMDYKISERVQVSVDILAQIDRDSNSITIEDRKANVKVAMSL